MTLAFRKLLWKDLRINRTLLWVVGAGVILPYLVALLIMAYGWHHYHAPAHSSTLVYAAMWGIALGILSVSLISGNAVAGERADRSAEFLAYLPVSHGRIIASKALVILGAGAIVWLVNLAVAGGLTSGFRPDSYAGYERDIVAMREEVLPAMALTTLLVWGLAWGCSCFLDSPVLSACAGIVAPILFFMLLGIVSSILPENTTFRPGPWYALVCVILGVAGCIGGTWYYLRRVEP